MSNLTALKQSPSGIARPVTPPHHFKWRSLFPLSTLRNFAHPRSGAESESKELGATSAGVSHKGCVRGENEDYFIVDEQNRFFILADGMGGHKGGAIASKLTANTVHQKLEGKLDQRPDLSEQELKEVICDCVDLAHTAVRAYSELDPFCDGMGTTLLFAIKQGDSLFVASIGDCRLYHLKKRDLRLVTKDETLVQALVDADIISSEVAKTHIARHVLTNSVSAKRSQPSVQIERIQLESGDRCIMVSDGVTNELEENELLKILSKKRDPKSAAETVLAETLRHAASDNVTAIVIDIHLKN